MLYLAINSYPSSHLTI